MKKLKSIAAILLVIALLGAVLISNFTFKTESGKMAIQYLDFLKDPLVIGILGAAFGFLIIDRWKNIEQEISETKKDQIETLKNIRDDAENIIKGRLESTNRKANAIESKIGGLLEEHPWISSITENDLIPDASSCRIVLNTCHQLIKTDRLPLVYEYLYGWINKSRDSEYKLSGTVADFMNLAEFCERFLGDEYLGLQIMKESANKASNHLQAYPEYLKKLIRSGHYEDARSVARYLRRQLPLTMGNKRLHFLRSKLYHAGFLFNSYTALMLYYALTDRVDKLDGVANTAKFLADKIEAIDYYKCIVAEVHIIRGEHVQARSCLDELTHESLPRFSAHTMAYSQEIVYHVARLYRYIGDIEKFNELIKLYQIDRLAELSIIPSYSTPNNFEDEELG